jgi:hypothetical protein
MKKLEVPFETQMQCMFTMSLAKIADGSWRNLKSQADWESQCGELLEHWTPEQRTDLFMRIAECLNSLTPPPGLSHPRSAVVPLGWGGL